MRFPTVTARDLTGASRRLPDLFDAPRSLVVLAFQRQQQADVDRWIAWAAREHPQVPTFEVPVISRRWRPLRASIDGGMAVAVRDDAVRRRTLTVYEDTRRITAPLDIPDRSAVVALAVDDIGAVLARALGVPGADPQAIAALDAALRATPPAR